MIDFDRPQNQLQELFNQPGLLLVVRQPGQLPKPAHRQPGIVSDYLQPYDDIFIAIPREGPVLAFNGHVDLGTGVRTALGQIVAEELYLPANAVRMILGHTSATPNQGPTVASATIQITSTPLRQAAAQAREHLLATAATLLKLPADSLNITEGRISAPDGQSLSYGDLIGNQHIRLEHNPDVPLKPVSQYTIIGKSVPRVDIPLKASGQLVYVHDVRLPGMWHARVVRPPYTGRDSGDFIGNSFISLDPDSVAAISPDIKIVQIADFVAVASQREEHAIRAAKALKIRWRTPPKLNLSDVGNALRHTQQEPRLLKEQGNIDQSEHTGIRLSRTYEWPYQMHASIGPSCSVAQFHPDGQLQVWTGSQNPHMLRAELGQLLQLDEKYIDVIRMEASGCYGRNCADDVGADAALIARAIGKPVRVQLTREQEHGWEPKGAAQLIDVEGSLDTSGNLESYHFVTRYPANGAPTLALILSGAIGPEPRILEIGDRTAVPPYHYPNKRIVCHDMAAIVRASWLRGVSALGNSFAHDSFIDELACESNNDPVEFRARFLKESRGRDVLIATAQRARWEKGARGSRGTPGTDGLLHGRGVAYARYTHSRFPGFSAAWNTWVIDLSVNPQSGKITVHRVVVGQDTGMIINPDGVRHQIRGNVIQTLSRTLKEQVSFDRNGVTALEWGAYPIMRFTDIPDIEIELLEHPESPPMGAGESAAVPCPAAVANALFDATGIRFYSAPFTPDTVRAALVANLETEPAEAVTLSY